ncbi:B-cell receptor CD22-like, partial [Clarias magur]
VMKVIRKKNFSGAAILLLLAGIRAQPTVTLSSQRICAVTGSIVNIPCAYSSYYYPTQKEWYRTQGSEGKSQDLSKDPQYSGRVSVNTVLSECDLTVRNVKVSDSGVYNFRFKTQRSDWSSNPSGVHLTVTDLQVKVDPNTVGQREVKVTCSSTCNFSTSRFYWYKNGLYNKYTYDASITLDSTSPYDEGSYSCMAYDGVHQSPSVCVLGKECWGVTYIHTQDDGEPVDVREDEEYQGRVQYTQSSQNDCSLRITNLRERDAQTYRFRFYTDGGDYTGENGVSLSITDLKVEVPDWGSKQKTLSCITTCTLSNPTYIWYKNGQRVTNWYRNTQFCSVRREGAGSYSCAVGGHEELRSPAVCVFENNCWSVTYPTQTICALTGSSVDIHSYYTYPYNNIMKAFWFIKDQFDDEPVDLQQVEAYQGRVQYTQSSQNNCSLRITNLRTTDSQTYRFRFSTNWEKFTGEPGVSLSVTDLRVIVSEWYNWKWKKLSCTSTCTPSNNPTYIWYKNGQRVTNQDRNELYLYDGTANASSYSCALKGHDEIRSSAVCVFDEKSCWSVTYSTQTICSLIGSSVDIHSYYTFPHYYKISAVFWFIKQQADGQAVDMREDDEYDGRIQYTQSSQNNCSLRITNLRETDAQTYRFRFHNDWDKYTGEPGVSLSVTDLTVSVSDWYNWKGKKLSCITTCTLSNKPTYIWYKNGERVTNQDRNELYVVSGDAGSYSCAVKGHEGRRSPAVYFPKNTKAVVLSSGDTVEGDSVTLSCSSDANPPVLAYSWFKQSTAADTLLTTGQTFRISSISSQDSGLYYCTAQNQLGQHNSTPTHLDVLHLPKNTRAVVLSSGDTVEGDSVTLSCSSDANPPILTYTWFKQRPAADTLLTTGQNYSISNISSQHSGLYYCTAHNQLGQHNSTPTELDILYSPRIPVVTAIPSLSGDSVTLLCKSDSNPISSCIWYSKTEGGVKIVQNGTNLTLPSGADGFYYCTTRNGLGSSSSLSWVYSEDRTAKYAGCGITVALVLSFTAVILWMRRRKSAVRSRSDDNSKNTSPPVYGNVSAMASDPTQATSSEDQDNVQYSSVYFRHSHIHAAPLYSTVQLPKAVKQKEEVEYATVSLVKPRAVRDNADMISRKKFFSAAAILMLLAGVEAQHSVTLSSQRLCVLTASTVKIPCRFTTRDHSSVTQREWYRVQSSKGKPQDLSTDPQYSGRVSVSTVTSDCELTVRNVRVSDSGVYNFRFKTQRRDWISASSGVHLTVTDLKVTGPEGRNEYINCLNTCTQSNNHKYIWYKNGQRVTEEFGNSLYIRSRGAGSYSCAVRGHEEHRSPAVCVYDQKSCWSVTYSTQTICSLIGSSVDIHSYYTFPNRHEVTKELWFIKEQPDAEPVGVREDEEYQGRVQYTQSSQNNCSLRITNLTERDTQTYRFRFLTHYSTGKYTGQPGVSLSVTDLKVTVSDWRDQYTTLSCITTCALSNSPTYIWYKNGQRVSDCKSASCSVAAVSGADSYSCAVEGHDSLLSPPVYSPKNTSAVVLSSGDTVEGDSVTLSCSSDANPPVLNYTWFKQRAAADTLLTTGQNYSISNISSQHSGLYYCTAHNQLGQHNSTPTELDVLYAPRITNVTAVPSVSGDSITLLCKSDSNPISNYTWTRRTEGGVKLTGNGNNLTLHSGADGLYVCTATNQLGSSDSSGWEYTSDNRAVKYTAIAVTVALVLIFIVIILWIRRRASRVSTRSEEHSKNDSVHIYDNISAMTSDPTQTASSEDHDNIQYSTVYFSQCPTDEPSLYSTVQLPKAVKQEEKVEYATVSLAKQIAIG